MELQDITQNINSPEALGRLRAAIVAERPAKSLKDAKEQYSPATHRIKTDLMYRPDKLINVDIWEGDGEDAAKRTVKATVQVARLTLPLQKRIVDMRASFLCGNPIELAANVEESNKAQENLLDLLQKVWDDNKLDYKSKQLAKTMMSATEVAELWYVDAAKDGYWDGTPNAGKREVLGVKILDSTNTAGLYPIYDKFDDMIAFCREYTRNEIDLVNNGRTKKVTYFDIYTADFTYYCQQEGNALNLIKNPEENPFGKIPIIYYKQAAPEWDDVQTLIDRLEMSMSMHADTNDYHGSPTVKVKGKVEGFSRKGEAGKVIELEEGADAEYMAYDKAPESVKLEQENLKAAIFNYTSTPDISFENIKGLGNFSGIALKMLFLDAHMKAADKEEIFGEAIQRRINLLKTALVYINPDLKAGLTLAIKPKFEYYLPKNDLEKIQMLETAVSGEKPLMGQKDAFLQNPLLEDPKQAWEDYEKQQQEEDKSATELNKLMNLKVA